MRTLQLQLLNLSLEPTISSSFLYLFVIYEINTSGKDNLNGAAIFEIASFVSKIW